MRLTLELERETDGRWIAEVVEIPGALAYGQTRDEAIGAAKALALRVVADRIEHGELSPDSPAAVSANSPMKAAPTIVPPTTRRRS